MILKDLPGLLRVFLHAPLDFRFAQIRARHPEIAPGEVTGVIRRSDRERSLFLRMLSELEWSDARQYDLSIDTGRIGMEAAEEIIVTAAEKTRGRLSE